MDCQLFSVPQFRQSKSFLISQANNEHSMLQRIQTLYLAIVAIACALLFFFPLANYYNEFQGNYKFFIYGIRCMDPEPKVVFNLFFTIRRFFLVLASVIMAFSPFRRFKTARSQTRLGPLTFLTTTVLTWGSGW